jgi:hypothetical protein
MNHFFYSGFAMIYWAFIYIHVAEYSANVKMLYIFS